jgi:hypothetical protein
VQTAVCCYLEVLKTLSSCTPIFKFPRAYSSPSIQAHRDFCKDGLGDGPMRSVVVNPFSVIRRFFGVRNEYLIFLPMQRCW